MCEFWHVALHPFAENGLKVLEKRGMLAFIYIEVNAGPAAKLVYYVEKDEHVLHRVGDESVVFSIPLAGEIQAARVDIVSPV
jgi:hypothetical protein